MSGSGNRRGSDIGSFGSSWFVDLDPNSMPSNNTVHPPAPNRYSNGGMSFYLGAPGHGLNVFTGPTYFYGAPVPNHLYQYQPQQQQQQRQQHQRHQQQQQQRQQRKSPAIPDFDWDHAFDHTCSDVDPSKLIYDPAGGLASPQLELQRAAAQRAAAQAAQTAGLRGSPSGGLNHTSPPQLQVATAVVPPLSFQQGGGGSPFGLPTPPPSSAVSEKSTSTATGRATRRTTRHSSRI